MNAAPPPSARAILHLDLDTFFVSVERLMDSRLMHQPILIGGTGDRGVVAACSYETRAFGVHSGMPMRQARLMCPEALVIRGNSMNYMKQSRAVTEIIQEAVPVCEKTSIDEFYEAAIILLLKSLFRSVINILVCKNDVIASGI